MQELRLELEVANQDRALMRAELTALKIANSHYVEEIADIRRQLAERPPGLPVISALLQVIVLS
jgi:hypothetical protein